MILHGYFRSSASYRVRIALNVKGLMARHISHHLRKGEQRAADYLLINTQGFVPTLITDAGSVLTQSMAILEWLEETHPEPPLLPREPLARAHVRAFAYAIACDIHPVQNLKVIARVRQIAGEEAAADWAKWVNEEGLDACEQMLKGQTGPFCFGEAPTMADVCLIPQMANARRFGCDMARWPRLAAIEAACKALPAFADAAPEVQPDAE
jgi:maleylpyruvate isomerase